MINRALTRLILCSLIMAGGWGVATIIDNKKEIEYGDPMPGGLIKNTTKNAHFKVASHPPNESSSFDDEFGQIQILIANQQFNVAVDFADQLYGQLSSNDLEKLKALFLNESSRLRQERQHDNNFILLGRLVQTFDDADVWTALGRASRTVRQWSTTVDAYLHASLLEHRPDQLEQILKTLTEASGQLRAELASRNDTASILKLQQSLYEHHPAYPQFQLALAEALLAIGDDQAAFLLLNSLRYDPDLGPLARQHLNTLESAADPVANDDTPKPLASDLNTSDISVPLIKVGSSFLTDVSFNGQAVRMLLDTGASITALSEQAINRLKLKPTGQNIRLATANGIRNAPLYYTGNIRLGRFNVEGLVIAKVDLGHTSDFQGLLGTDLLSQAHKDYGYLIDNQRQTLIFRRY